MVKKIAIGLLLLTGTTLYAQTTTVSLDSGSVSVFNQASTPLSGGSALIDGDGAVLQLGYYDAATTANNFAGNWVPLTGQTSANIAIVPGSSPAEPYNATSIGDTTANGGSDGTFFLSGLNFTVGDLTSGNSLPASNTIPLAIRFYNGTTIATSTFFNVVSDDLWLWKTPSTPAVNVALSLDDPNLEWLSIAQGQNANTAFHTTVTNTAIPEPSTIASLFIGASSLGLALIRRRLKS
jgi:hypothetical protein